MNPSFLPTGFATICAFSMLVLLAGGCTTSTSQQPKKSVAPPSTVNAAGVSISPTGEAVAEVDAAPDKLFEVAEAFFRKRYKITFINYSLRQFDAEDKKIHFAFRINELTTGQVGLCLAVTDRGRNQPNSSLAREFVNEILQLHRQSSRK